MINAKDYFEAGLVLHGHKCPAMPMGLRVGAAALNALGVDRAKDGQLDAIVELGEDHCATCFADGVQMITGCTFGKGNIRKTNLGKWGVTIVDRSSGRSVRVAPRGEAMIANKQSKFFSDYREKGIPASKVPDEVVAPMIEKVMTMPDDMLLKIGEITQVEVKMSKHSFDGFLCESCGEMVAEPYGRIHNEKKFCISCRASATQENPR